MPFDVWFTHRTPAGFNGTVLRRRFGELARATDLATHNDLVLKPAASWSSSH